MCERVCSFMFELIEFYEIPEEYEILLDFADGRGRSYRCRLDISHGNRISEIYDADDNVIATNMNDLREMGVVASTLIQSHDIEVN